MFTTETDPFATRSNIIKAIIITFAILSGLSCLGFLISWQAFCFFEAINIISITYSYVRLLKKDNHAVLRFEGSELFIELGEKKDTYEVYDIPASDFVINQTKKQKKIDYCDLTIKNTIFIFGNVKKCRELKEYIKQHYI